MEYPKFKNTGAMDESLQRALDEGHEHFKLLFKDGHDDDFILSGFWGEDIELDDRDTHPFDCIFDEDILSFIALD